MLQKRKVSDNANFSVRARLALRSLPYRTTAPLAANLRLVHRRSALSPRLKPLLDEFTLTACPFPVWRVLRPQALQLVRGNQTVAGGSVTIFNLLFALDQTHTQSWCAGAFQTNSAAHLPFVPTTVAPASSLAPGDSIHV